MRPAVERVARCRRKAFGGRESEQRRGCPADHISAAVSQQFVLGNRVIPTRQQLDAIRIPPSVILRRSEGAGAIWAIYVS
jgi:hypothetical protein